MWKNVRFSHSVEKREILSHQKNISSYQLYSNQSSKSVTFTKFLPKMCDREFLKFPHSVSLRHIFDKNYVKVTFLLKK